MFKLSWKQWGAVALLAGTLAALGACGGSDGAAPPDTAAPAQWNTIAARAVINDGTMAPMQSSRVLAMAMSAAHDALNAIDPRYQPYLTSASAPQAHADAAIAAAVATVMKDALPSQAAFLDAQLQQALAAVPEGAAKTAGLALGQQTAKAIIAARSGDGAGPPNVPAYNYTPGPGVYEPTPPIGGAFFVGWGAVKPFGLTRASQFRAPPPYAVTDTAYTADFQEVKLIGGAKSTLRNPDQTVIARFWLQDTHTAWARIALQLAKDRRVNGWDQQRLLALVYLAQADAYISSLEAKYTYNFWRPITAIRKADTDGNPDTVADPDWTPLDPVTPPIPDYPSAHATSGGAGEAVLQAVLGSNTLPFTVTSDTLPDETRSYASVSQASVEMGLSRIYVGYHFRRAVDEGRKQGFQVGTWVAAKLLAKR